VPAPAGQGASSLTDDELLAGIRLGSEAHFSELYNRYFHRIYTFAYARLSNHADAEEVAQETFTSVFRSFDAYRGQSSLLSWIYGIAKNTANGHLRRSRTQETRLESIDADQLAPLPALSSCAPDEQLDLRLFTEAVERSLSDVAEWQVDVFCMRHFDNLSIADICERTDRSSDAVRSCLYRVKRIFIKAAEPAVAS
jgi:RNA polymerase sigma-70 factor (ECF subfamily)